MTILLSNDDGFLSPGIRALMESVRDTGAEVFLVAPASDRSTVGHSLTLHKPLRVYETEPFVFSVSGSPADCVYWATRFLLKRKPDAVISGINKGANLGFDHFYSGTVAAAREGALFGIRSMAVSLTTQVHVMGGNPHWKTAAAITARLLPDFLKLNYDVRSTVLNLNVPDISLDQIRGLRISSQGSRQYSDEVREGVDPRGKKYYWIGGAYQGFSEIPGTDCQDVHEGYATLTPLKIDTTNLEMKSQLKGWENLGLR